MNMSTELASYWEAREKLRVADMERARISGYGQGLKALVAELPTFPQDETDQYVQGFRQALGTVYEWIDAKLKELGEEAREER